MHLSNRVWRSSYLWESQQVQSVLKTTPHWNGTKKNILKKPTWKANEWNDTSKKRNENETNRYGARWKEAAKRSRRRRRRKGNAAEIFVHVLLRLTKQKKHATRVPPSRPYAMIDQRTPKRSAEILTQLLVDLYPASKAQGVSNPPQGSLERLEESWTNPTASWRGWYKNFETISSWNCPMFQLQWNWIRLDETNCARIKIGSFCLLVARNVNWFDGSVSSYAELINEPLEIGYFNQNSFLFLLSKRSSDWGSPQNLERSLGVWNGTSEWSNWESCKESRKNRSTIKTRPMILIRGVIDFDVGWKMAVKR